LNKNLKRLARKNLLKAKRSNIIVLEDFNFETPNTKNFINVLKALELENKKVSVCVAMNKKMYICRHVI
jgi:large subunit ribosomal protein L4